MTIREEIAFSVFVATAAVMGLKLVCSALDYVLGQRCGPLRRVRQVLGMPRGQLKGIPAIPQPIHTAAANTMTPIQYRPRSVSSVIEFPLVCGGTLANGMGYIARNALIYINAQLFRPMLEGDAARAALSGRREGWERP
jgi:hypothetical protein